MASIRVYSHWLNNRRIQLLTDANFRVWFHMLLYMAKQPERGYIRNYDWYVLSVEIAGGDEDLLEAALKQMLEHELITWTPTEIASTTREAFIGGGRYCGSDWKERRQSVFDRDSYQCQYCGDIEGPLHCDHIMPISRGGSNDYDNLTTACYKCNISKKDMTPEEWRAKKSRRERVS